MPKLIRTETHTYGFKSYKHYVYSCIDCGAEYTRRQYHDGINPYCGKCSSKHQKIRDDANRKKRQEAHDKQIQVETIDNCIDLIKQNYSCYDDKIYDICNLLERSKQHELDKQNN